MTLSTDEVRAKEGKAGDSREEKDTQWRQVITLYTRILKTFAASEYFMRSYVKEQPYHILVYWLYLCTEICKNSEERDGRDLLVQSKEVLRER